MTDEELVIKPNRRYAIVMTGAEMQELEDFCDLNLISIENLLDEMKGKEDRLSEKDRHAKAWYNALAERFRYLKVRLREARDIDI